ncbi:MAG: glycosyltransferase [Betaproteobacteria bacterium]|nr:glycosyltransferase [Betaproteobacteria bacterium]
MRPFCGCWTNCGPDGRSSGSPAGARDRYTEIALNIHIYPSIFANESRILKIVRSLRGHDVFTRVVVLALWKAGLPRHEVLEDGIEVMRVEPLFGGGLHGWVGRLLKIVGWYLGVLLALRGQTVICFNCHSLPVLPLSVLVKFWKRCALVYDPHELETETAGLSGRRQWLARRVESALIRRADIVCVVNRSIADWYVARYRIQHVWVVRNVPYRTEKRPVRTGALRRAVGLSPEAQLYLYQGLLAPGRGVGMLIEAFSGMPDRHLVFMGYGELEGQIREAAVHHANIHFMAAVPPSQVKDYTVDADVGIALIENVCLSYYLCLPNKLFEYVACGVPAVVSDFPELGRFVDEYDCGWKTVPDAQALRQLMQGLTAEELAAKRTNTRDSGWMYCWEEEEKTLLAMYRELGFNLAGGRHAPR